MSLVVRPLGVSEVAIVVDYFHDASPEYLEVLGVDPTRIPGRGAFAKALSLDVERDLEKRYNVLLGWFQDGLPIGFSSADKIVVGDHAFMHLHLLRAGDRRRGLGVEGVRLSVEFYFRSLRLQYLLCEPNAHNVAPNRTLQRAGFSYVKTHRTVPGNLNFHQDVTRWEMRRPVDAT